MGKALGRVRGFALAEGPADETPQRLTPYAAGKRAARRARLDLLVRRVDDAVRGVEHRPGRAR